MRKSEEKISLVQVFEDQAMDIISMEFMYGTYMCHAPTPAWAKRGGATKGLRLLNLLFGHWWAHFIYKSIRK